MHTKYKRLFIGAIAIVLLGAAGLFAVDYLGQNTNQQSTQNTTQQIEESQINDVITFNANPGTKVLDQLRAINDSVVTVESEMGVYVDSINGLAGGTDGKYWSYYVDSQMATVGADQFVPEGGEVIEWKFQKL